MKFINKEYQVFVFLRFHILIMRMDKHLIETLVVAALFLLGSSANGLMATSPGDRLLENEELLQSRIENMNTCITPFYNAEVKKRLSFLLKTKKVYTETMLGRMVQYYPLIDSMLAAHDLPKDLKYITIIESSLKADIRSHAGAAGLWQFMKATGKYLGLRVNWAVDERLDPYLATQAAIKYLEYLHSIYDDWTLVLMAYNAGPGRVNRAIDRAGGAIAYDSIAEYLPQETRDYIPKFTAATFFMKNYTELGYTPEWPSLDKQFLERVKVYDRIKLSEFSEELGIPEETLEHLNPAFIRDYIPKSSKGYYLTIPLRYAVAVDSFLAHYGDKKIESIPLDVQTLSPVVAGDSSSQSNPDSINHYLSFIYEVQLGDSWKEIADIFNLNHFRLKYWNNTQSSYLYPRQKLKIFVPHTERNKVFIFLLTDEKFVQLNNNAYLSTVVERNEDVRTFLPNVALNKRHEPITIDRVINKISRANFKVH